MEAKDITKLVRNGYSEEKVVDHYGSASGVWPEEKFIFDTFFKNVGHVLDIGCGGWKNLFLFNENRKQSYCS